jgi:hypothetical protein
MVPQKPLVWSSCKALVAMEWQRHFERHATPQMGRNCGFWDQASPVPHRAASATDAICGRHCQAIASATRARRPRHAAEKTNFVPFDRRLCR